jgi:hypothetical protein
MPLFSMKFRPGINKDQTDYTNEGGWFDSDKVRFNNGLPEVIGGWEKKTTYSFLGSCRSLHAWVATDSELYLTVGTNIKYYVDEGGAFYDITPIRTTTSAGAITFAAVNGSSTITVTNLSHGALENDFVTFSGAVSLGGQITAAILNQEYQVETIIDGDNYTIAARTVSSILDITVGGVLVPTTVNADGSDTGNGGASVVGVYQINTGLDTTVAGIGWGAGTWGRGTWGSAATSPTTGQILRLWSEDNWGEDLIFNVRDGPIYYWDKSSGTSTRGVLMSSLGGASGVPTVSRKTIVSNQQRQVVSFGVNEIGSSDQDLMLVRYSDFESAVNWTTTLENNAGRQLLSNGSAIITAFETQKEILIWTDTCVYSMQFVGGDLVYRFEIASLGPSIIGPNAAVSADNAVFWMDTEEFYVYTGRAQPIPAPLRSMSLVTLTLINLRRLLLRSTRITMRLLGSTQVLTVKTSTNTSHMILVSKCGRLAPLTEPLGLRAGCIRSRLPLGLTAISITKSLVTRLMGLRFLHTSRAATSMPQTVSNSCSSNVFCQT